MDRAEPKAQPLSGDEFKALFEIVAEGRGKDEAQRRLPCRARVTVNRAYNVVSEFERRALLALNDAAAEQIADAAKYSATPHYVQQTFLQWKAWKTVGPPSTSAHLLMGSPCVGLYTDGIARARYATVDVASDVEARDCWAWVQIRSSGVSFPLHWAGTPATAEESSAPRTTISPLMPARLDIAMALPPRGQTYGPEPGAIMSGDVSMFVGGPAEPPWNGEGCWLAQPVALYHPSVGLRSYLPPGEYTIRVRVGCQGSEEVTRDYVLTSPTSWEGLALRPA